REGIIPFDREKEGVVRWIADAATLAEYRPENRATLVAAAWWSDVVRRKHVRVVGRRLEPGNGLRTNRFGPLMTDWPPLGLVYPERIIVRTIHQGTNKTREVLALCDCGTIGAPASIGWTGERCGPCHDRQGEGGVTHTSNVMTRSGIIWTGHDLGGVAYSKEGNLVWASSEGKIGFD